MLRYPVDYVGITQYYSRNHRGIDLGWHNTTSEPILAAADGLVVDCGTESVYGAIYAVLRHEGVVQDKTVYTLYWHLRSLAVAKGQTVRQGQTIGIMGDTGLTTGVHLHYEAWVTPRSYTAWRLSDKEKYAVDPRTVTYLWPDQQKSRSSQGVQPRPEPTPDDGALVLTREPLYASSTAARAAGSVSGRYWRWDDQTVHGRIRITNSPERIGISGQVTGWIAAPTAARRTYTVVAGDTLSGIAAKNGLTLAQLVALNTQIQNPNLILVGQTVYLN